MEPQSGEKQNVASVINNETKESFLAPAHKVTTFSKLLAAGMFIVLPFVGGYVGYMNAPEKVVEVPIVSVAENSDNEDSGTLGAASSSSDTRRILTRAELIKNEVNLAHEFNIDITDPSLGTAPLYFAQDSMAKQSENYVTYSNKGLTLLLPYDEGQGWPFYKLTPFDEVQKPVHKLQVRSVYIQ